MSKNIVEISLSDDEREYLISLTKSRTALEG